MFTCKICNCIATHLIKGTNIHLCNNCFEKVISTCKHCGKTIIDLGEHCKINEDGDCICSCCITKHYKKCSCKCEIIPKDEDFCFRCYSNNYINSYGFKPQPNFKFCDGEKSDLFVGVELELNFDHGKSAKSFLSYIGKVDEKSFVYLKHDGSLGRFGVEIVSHPATFSYHLKTKEWKNIFSYLKDTNTLNCGLHFHLSKLGLKEKEIVLLDYMVNNYHHLIMQIGGRALKDYCRSVVSPVWGLKRIYRSNHTDACNLTNDKTIELRFCKSTNNYNSFMKKIKNIFVLIQFVKTVCQKNQEDKVMNNKNKEKVEKLFKYFQGELLSRI